MSDTPQDTPHAAMAEGLRDLADFLDANPAAPLPLGVTASRHMDAGEFDAATEALGLDIVDKDSAFWRAMVTFGPVTYWLQTDGLGARRRELDEREKALDEREAAVSPVHVTGDGEIPL